MVDWEIVKKLVKVVKEEEITGLAVEEGGVKYEVRREAAAVAAAHPAVTAAPAKTEENDDSGLAAITSPMVGTFYRSPSPESPPFVDVGDSVASGKVVCIIEAMKLFNEIESDISGRIVKILVENGQPVEYGQKLMLISKA